MQITSKNNKDMMILKTNTLILELPNLEPKRTIICSK